MPEWVADDAGKGSSLLCVCAGLPKMKSTHSSVQANAVRPCLAGRIV